ncbi:estradiol 17-beta-dehydrogenase 2 [Caerostris extrusa]|uniref:Estradiol 17-beta-dehydrogenase 2 n=1 Tax=Caerostris extrusa TaxID=172846 RepID=A0AAV4N0L5_CAEEX|nr:estradiol 17-beta-dehydrogenase 2 [Caerostris extrusa]
MHLIGRYALVGVTHFLCTGLALKVLSYILPCFLTCYYGCAAKFLMCAIVAQLTFGFTKKKFLSDKIQPDNKAVLITGCDCGFGHQLAKRLDKGGYHVFASCLNPNGPGADDLKKSCSKRLQIVEMDVTKDDSVKEAVNYVKDNLGTSELWAIVNNAGIQKGFITELTSIQDFKDTMEVNAFGPVRVTKGFLPLLRQSRGRVINIASLAGRISLPACAPYAMSKFACVAFSESLRYDLDVWGVRVISIEPEFFQTDMTKVENLRQRVDDTFASIDDDVREDYGKKFIEDFRARVNLMSASSKVYKVLNALELAISLEHPSLVYRPCRNCIVAVLYRIFEYSPKVMQLLMVKFYFYITGFPKPKEADNNL